MTLMKFSDQEMKDIIEALKDARDANFGARVMKAPEPLTIQQRWEALLLRFETGATAD